MADDDKDEKKKDKKDDKKSEQKELSLKECSETIAMKSRQNQGEFVFKDDKAEKAHLHQAIEKFKSQLKLADKGFAEAEAKATQEKIKTVCKTLQTTLETKRRELLAGTSNHQEWEAACKTAKDDIGKVFDSELKGKAPDDVFNKVKQETLDAFEKEVKETGLKQELNALHRSVKLSSDRMDIVRQGVKAAGELKYQALTAAERDALEKKKQESKAREVFHLLNEPFEYEPANGENDYALMGVTAENKLIRAIRHLVERLGDEREDQIFESSAFKGVKLYKDAKGGIHVIPPGDNCQNFEAAMDLLALGAGANSYLLRHPDPSKVQTVYGVKSIVNMMELAQKKGRPLELDWKMTLRLHELRQERIDFHKEDMFFKRAGLALARYITGNPKTWEDPVIKEVDKILAMQADMKKRMKDAEKAEKKRLGPFEARTKLLDEDIQRLKSDKAKVLLQDSKFKEKLDKEVQAEFKKLEASAPPASSGGLAADPLLNKNEITQGKFVNEAKTSLLRDHPNADSSAEPDKALKEISAQVDALQKEVAVTQRDSSGIKEEMIRLKELAQEHPDDATLYNSDYVSKLAEKTELLDPKLIDLEVKVQAWQEILKDVKATGDQKDSVRLLSEKMAGLRTSIDGTKKDVATLLTEPKSSGNKDKPLEYTEGSLAEFYQDFEKITGVSVKPKPAEEDAAKPPKPK